MVEESRGYAERRGERRPLFSESRINRWAKL
jgi:hypothetical protein